MSLARPAEASTTKTGDLSDSLHPNTLVMTLKKTFLLTTHSTATPPSERCLPAFAQAILPPSERSPEF